MAIPTDGPWTRGCRGLQQKGCSPIAGGKAGDPSPLSLVKPAGERRLPLAPALTTGGLRGGGAAPPPLRESISCRSEQGGAAGPAGALGSGSGPCSARGPGAERSRRGAGLALCSLRSEPPARGRLSSPGSAGDGEAGAGSGWMEHRGSHNGSFHPALVAGVQS